MTRDEMVRMARDAGVHAPGGPNWEPFIASLERFANLVISDFLARSGRYVTNDASREAVINAARLDGWQAAREQAAKLADNLPSRWDGSTGMMLTKELSSGILAMQPPAEWQCAEVPPVCGAAPNRQLSTDEIKAMVGEEDFRKGPKWPHPDGFAGGLTERIKG